MGRIGESEESDACDAHLSDMRVSVFTATLPGASGWLTVEPCLCRVAPAAAAAGL